MTTAGVRVRVLHFLQARPGLLFLWLGLAALAFGAFAGMTGEMLEGEADTTDRAILVAVSHTRTTWLTAVAIDLTALGSTTLIVLFSVVGLLVLNALRDRRGAIHLAVAATGGGILTYATKNLIERARPTVVPRLVEVTGFSYPSGHSLMTAALYITLAVIAGRYARDWRARSAILLTAFALVTLVGASRVYLGVHYPTDVASGVSLGAAWALLVAAAFLESGRQNQRRPG